MISQKEIEHVLIFFYTNKINKLIFSIKKVFSPTKVLHSLIKTDKKNNSGCHNWVNADELRKLVNKYKTSVIQEDALNHCE